MWIRLIGLAVVLFWVAMTALLLRVTYFPEFNRLPRVDPGHVLELFLNQSEVTELYIYRDGEVVGDVMLTSRQAADGSGRVNIGFAAAGGVELPSLPRQKLNWRGSLELSNRPRRQLQRIELNVRFTQPALSVSMEIDPRTLAFDYEVTQSGVVVSTSKDGAGALGIMQMQLLLAAWNIDPSGRGDEIGVWDARQGSTRIAKHRAGAYFMALKLEGVGEIMLTFSEAGELLRIDTPFGYQLLSEAMRTPPDPLPY